MKHILFPMILAIVFPFIFYYFRRRNTSQNSIENEGTPPAKKKPKLWIYVALVTFLLSLTIFEANMGLRHGVLLQVQKSTIGHSNYHSFNLPNHNYFTPEEGGKLYWYPKNLLQALLLDTTIKHAALDIFEIILLYITVAIFYFMTLGSGKKSVFSVNLLGGYLLIFFLIAISGILKSFEYSWMSILLRK